MKQQRSLFHLKPKDMKTLNLREKKSGNFEITTKENATHTFKTKKSLVNFYANLGRSKVIKATYRLSQVYFSNVNELLGFLGEKPVKVEAKKVVEYTRFDL